MCGGDGRRVRRIYKNELGNSGGLLSHFMSRSGSDLEVVLSGF